MRLFVTVVAIEIELSINMTHANDEGTTAVGKMSFTIGDSWHGSLIYQYGLHSCHIGITNIQFWLYHLSFF